MLVTEKLSQLLKSVKSLYEKKKLYKENNTIRKEYCLAQKNKTKQTTYKDSHYENN